MNSRNFADYIFLGQGPFFGIAQEAMLKVKEMSCSYGQCFHTLEFRHGPKAIVSNETLLTFFLSDSRLRIRTRGPRRDERSWRYHSGRRESRNAGREKIFPPIIELGLTVPEFARPAAAVIPGQLLGFYTGIRKGLDPDNPRNLSRVVMLEGK